MKKLLLSFVAIALAVISVRAQVEINSTNFPDDNFRAQVKEAFDNIEEDDIIVTRRWKPTADITPSTESAT